jgi:ankyrin repeat protein
VLEQAEWADAHGNTLLSEAAAGGALSVCKYLLDVGYDPNTRGEFKRTPLWRAAFLGKQDIVIALLAGGADPRY